MKAYKILTHDFRSPIRGGSPIFDGKLPFMLPSVTVDEGPDECAAGWNACRDLATALRIGGLWSDGWPSKAFVVEDPHRPVVERNDKIRAASWMLTVKCSEAEIEAAIVEMSKPFSEYQAEMVKEQMAWREALGRPLHDEGKVVEGLKVVLEKRGLKWKLKKFDNAWDARVARDAWDAWDARVARDARDAWVARDAWDAWVALTVFYASRMKWIEQDADLLTVGIRDAYRYGLAVALPTEKDELGWAMVEEE